MQKTTYGKRYPGRKHENWVTEGIVQVQFINDVPALKPANFFLRKQVWQPFSNRLVEPHVSRVKVILSIVLYQNHDRARHVIGVKDLYPDLDGLLGTIKVCHLLIDRVPCVVLELLDCLDKFWVSTKKQSTSNRWAVDRAVGPSCAYAVVMVYEDRLWVYRNANGWESRDYHPCGTWTRRLL